MNSEQIEKAAYVMRDAAERMSQAANLISETMRSIGIVLEWPPLKWAYQIVLVGTENRDGRGPLLDQKGLL